MSAKPQTRKGTQYVCVTCFKVFRPHKYTSKYCSHSCRPSWNEGLTRETEPRIAAYWQGKERHDIAGENCHFWKKDRTSLVIKEKKHLDTRYRIWMREVKNRDGWKCKIGNKDCVDKLEAHHILSWKDFPEVRYDINNGITLCHAHHPRKRAEEKRLASFFRELVTASKE